MSISFLLLFIIFLFLSFWKLKNWIFHYIKLVNTYWCIPSPPRRLLLLGNLLDFPLDPYQLTLKTDAFYRQRTQESLGCSWVGTYPVIAFFRPIELEHFFAVGKNLTKAPDYAYLYPWLRTGLLTSNGEKWKTRRRIITPAFHDKKLLEHFVEIYNEQAKILVQHLSTIESNKEVNLYPYITLCALDIICETAMGTSIEAQSKKNSEYVDAIFTLTEVILKRARMPWLWPDFLFKYFPEGREHDRCLNIVHQFTKKVIHNRAQEFHTKKIQGKRSAFLDILLKQMNDEQLSLDDIQEEVDTFMFEGHDTTAAAMNFTCFMIASHPDVQDKLYEEIKKVFGDDNDRPCTMEDINELVYLECVIKETLRLFPSVPFIAREVQEDFTYDGYKILQGTTALIFIYYIHRDPKYFPDPERFDPDRFLPENSVDRPPFAFIPFSAGSRNCIGQRFALLEEKVILSSILRRFKLKTYQTVTDLHITFEILLRPQNKTLVQIEHRY